jgi:hypothetical protein
MRAPTRSLGVASGESETPSEARGLDASGNEGNRERRPLWRFMSPPSERSAMFRDRSGPLALLVGVAAAVVALGYEVGTDLVRVPASSGVPYAEMLVSASVLIVPFALGAAGTVLAVRHRVVVPLGSVAVFAAAPAVFGWHAEQVLVGVLVVGPLVVVGGLFEALVRLRLGRFLKPPSGATLRALSVGMMAAVVYFGVFAFRAVLPLWRIDTGGPATVGSTADLGLLLWYVFGVAAVLVGPPVALNRRWGLVAPLGGLLAYLLVDLAFLQPAVAEGAELVVLLLLGVWPSLAGFLAAVGLLEWWLRTNRGQYDESEDDEKGGGGLSVEGGLFGDRI